MPRTRKSKPRSPDHAALGQAIEMLIAEDAHMTQDTVADDGGLTTKQINDFVRGQGNPTYTTLIKLARGLHVTPGRLITLRDELYDKRSRR
jgi:transcriptional regulator with XRE-family HTH domain